LKELLQELQESCTVAMAAPSPVLFETGEAGRKGAKQWNEDSYVHVTSATNRVCACAVFDGHGGYNGLLAATCARDYFR
jgi:hypothetical protein